MKRRDFLQTLALTAASSSVAGLTAGSVWAASYPTKSVRIIVPFSPGGSADKLSRTLAQKLGELWKQSVVVENVTGASGTIAEAQVARAPADGHTILLSSDQVALNATLFNNLPYDSLKDFTPITQAVVSPQILVVRPGLGIKTFQQYVDYLKANPGKFTLALPTNGGIAHIAHELLSSKIGVRPNYIPYPGGGPAVLDILGGHIDGTLITLAAVTEHIRAGKLVALAVTPAQRSKAVPEVPTIGELGVKDYAVESWQGYTVRSNTPKAVVDQLGRDITGILRQPDVHQQLENLGFAVAASTPAQAEAVLQRDIPVFRKVIQDSGIKLK